MSEIFTGKIRSLTFKGLGVVDHPDGLVYFVQGAWPGDEGQFQITSKEKRYGFADLKELTTPSPQRQKPPCPYLGFQPGECGGCPWMIATYESQLEQKQGLVAGLLTRAKILKDDSVLKQIWGSPKNYGYRNRAQLKTDGNLIGYISPGTNILAPVDDCIILDETCRNTFKDLKSQLPKPQWRPKDDVNWTTLDIDDDMVAADIVINHKRNFKQANTEQNKRMQDWLKNNVKTHDRSKTVLELFSGSGNFTEIFSKGNFEKIVAAEVSAKSIEQLKKRNLKNVEGHVVDLFKSTSWNGFKKFSKSPQILFLDPPREGFTEIGGFLKMFNTIKDIYYVSCDVSTFVEDTKKILKMGYEIVEIQPVDQFPQTPHIEIMANFTKI